MSQNPFESLGGAGGGLDMNALLQQAQQMQEQLQQAQERLAEAEVEGTVAGGAVTVRVNGVGELVGVDIKAREIKFRDDDRDIAQRHSVFGLDIDRRTGELHGVLRRADNGGAYRGNGLFDGSAGCLKFRPGMFCKLRSKVAKIS